MVVLVLHELSVLLGRIAFGVERLEAVLACSIAGVALLVIEDPLVYGFDVGLKDA